MCVNVTQALGELLLLLLSWFPGCLLLLCSPSSARNQGAQLYWLLLTDTGVLHQHTYLRALMILCHHTPKASPHISTGYREPHSSPSVPVFTTDEVTVVTWHYSPCLTGSVEFLCPSLLWIIACTNRAGWGRTASHFSAFTALLWKRGGFLQDRQCTETLSPNQVFLTSAYAGVPCGPVNQRVAED